MELLKPLVFIGVDPGAHGGIAAISPEPPRVRYISLNGLTEDGKWTWLSSYAGLEGQAVAVVEQISAGGFGGTEKSSMAKLYGSYMQMRAFLTAAGIPFVSTRSEEMWRALGVMPRKRPKWVKYFGKKPRKPGVEQLRAAGGETTSEWKGRLFAKAQELFPHNRIDLDVADSLLIAKYCQMTMAEQTRWETYK